MYKFKIHINTKNMKFLKATFSKYFSSMYFIYSVKNNKMILLISLLNINIRCNRCNQCLFLQICMRNQLSQIIKESINVKPQTPISVHKFRVTPADDNDDREYLRAQIFVYVRSLLDALMSPYKKDRSD